ncbi:MAG: amidohydrolase family protein [Chitinophagaceae bacterium]|nr:amidohydrolase family protein [Chitinophagaceae bacterium]
MNFFTTRKVVKQVANTNYLDIDHHWFGKDRYKWLLIIIDLLRKYPNVYADISFTLHDKAIYSELKELLKDESINKKILFGTDYYVVASVADESDLLNLFKKELGDDALFEMIAYENPKRFLGW